MAKLTIRQLALIDLASDPAFGLTGLRLSGPREFRTAQSLERRGLGSIDVEDRLTITPAGLSALQKGEGK